MHKPRRFWMFIAVLALLVIGTVPRVTATTPPPVKMAWSMDESGFALRDATLTAYPVGASDFEVPVRCAYLGDFGVYVWQFRAVVPAHYQTVDWILAGYAHGLVVAQKFTIQNGATLALAPIPWAAPAVAPRMPAQDVTVNYDPPPLDPAVVLRWEVLQDGKPLPLDASGNGVGGTLDRVRTTGLRAVLAGTPKAHYLTGPALEITPDLGDRT